MRILLTVALCIFSVVSFSQDKVQEQPSADNILLLKSFIRDLANENKAVDIILSKYIIVDNPSDELYDYLEVSLQEVRINLLSKKLDAIEYIPYRAMPKKEVLDIDPEGLKTENMYFLRHKGRQMLAVYVENGKIGSFTLVSKGFNKAHFVRY